ncbi:conserved Plasmodium protein, unknown function [Plasmodium yoelii]|uniref:Uncharacterized protein n=2 Tax=Plasmodium yoelii TaxID=5861 RepID=Q7RK02_PLAYO|nr:conserved Plasmodium protein, unknown function [Plasmodium yoelii]EAA22635.1 hypothetical protein [Plasmodium yoelii yoelii]CDU16519.1 conserved Plasmodium protein, unknown function [Plasmodium yoelii]VTZ73378.1 conserved Plasmodium protein, unknown function [Plasmodium yoelii]|eukprot:XP_731070.1 conserved Plasmodium protein, unknown function [Plasmodium yoelii]
MPFKSYSVFLLYIILFHVLNVICLINKNLFFITNPPKSISHFSRIKSKDIRFKKKIFVKVPFRGIRQKLLLFDKLKNGFFFFKYIQPGKNEKFWESILMNLNEITKVKELVKTTKDIRLEKDDIEKIFQHAILSKINFKTINTISYLIKHFKIDRNTISSVLDIVSKQIKDPKSAEHFLSLYSFLLEDDIALFSIMHIVDFFKSKHKVLETLQNIKAQIYDECANDLVRKKIERYNIFCERENIKYNLEDGLKKIKLNIQEDDIYFNYDYKYLLKIFEKKTKRYDNIGTVKDEVHIISDQGKIDEYIDIENHDCLKELKKTYEKLQSFNDSIIEHIESDQDLFYFNDNEHMANKRKKKNINKYEQNNNINETEEDEDEDTIAMQKNIDDYIEKYKRDNNSSVEHLKNIFVEQADIDLKNFLETINLDNNIREENETNMKTLRKSNKHTIENFEGLYENNQNKSREEITNFRLKQLNQSDEALNITNDIFYERMRIKLLYYIQKIEYMKYKHQYEILNERYPINKSEKTILDLLKYGYKIDVSPDVDNSMFKKNVNIEKDKMVDGHHPIISFKQKKYYDFKCPDCGYHIFNTNEEINSSSIQNCPQCSKQI